MSARSARRPGSLHPTRFVRPSLPRSGDTEPGPARPLPQSLTTCETARRKSFRSDADQCRVLLYLGLVASGIGFFLWNKGAALCRTGTLAAFNNAVVPLAMACSIFIFGELGEVTGITLVRLLLGALCITGAVFLAECTPVNEG